MDFDTLGEKVEQRLRQYFEQQPVREAARFLDREQYLFSYEGGIDFVIRSDGEIYFSSGPRNGRKMSITETAGAFSEKIHFYRIPNPSPEDVLAIFDREVIPELNRFVQSYKEKSASGWVPERYLQPLR